MEKQIKELERLKINVAYLDSEVSMIKKEIDKIKLFKFITQLFIGAIIGFTISDIVSFKDLQTQVQVLEQQIKEINK